MKCVAISRILDEVDIVEAFVRHTAAFVQHHIFMDNGSRDGTVEILQKLSGEGFSITVYQNLSVSFSEQSFMTFMYQQAVERHDADWVYCLDCDEFIHDRGLPGGITAYLEKIISDPTDQIHVHLEWGIYKARSSDDANEFLVPKRIVYRDPIAAERNKVDDHTSLKIIINARVGVLDVVVDNGGHHVLLSGIHPPDTRFVTGACLAHYFERSPFQLITKSTRGWAKVLAAGYRIEDKGISHHYQSVFNHLRDNPGYLLRNDHFLGFRYDCEVLVHDPIDYRGAALRYTPAIDPAMSAVTAIAGYIEDLSRRHGKLVDDFPLIRRFVDEQNQTHTKIIGDPDPIPADEKDVAVNNVVSLPAEATSLDQRLLRAKIYAQMQMKKLRYVFGGNRPASSESRMPGFDEKYYLYWYRDVQQYAGEPLQHYLTQGWKEGRDPSSGFSTDGYLANNPDVRDSLLNPLLHFVRHGLVEGREGWQKNPRAPAPEPRRLHRSETDQPR